MQFERIESVVYNVKKATFFVILIQSKYLKLRGKKIIKEKIQTLKKKKKLF